MVLLRRLAFAYHDVLVISHCFDRPTELIGKPVRPPQRHVSPSIQMTLSQPDILTLLHPHSWTAPGKIDTIEEGSWSLRRLKGALVVNARGTIVAPGFIDLHIHGASGGDTSDCSLESLRKMSSTLARFGTTSFLPTIYPQAGCVAVPDVSGLGIELDEDRIDHSTELFPQPNGADH